MLTKLTISRSCIGQRFAKLEVLVMAAKVGTLEIILCSWNLCFGFPALWKLTQSWKTSWLNMSIKTVDLGSIRLAPKMSSQANPQHTYMYKMITSCLKNIIRWLGVQGHEKIGCKLPKCHKILIYREMTKNIQDFLLLRWFRGLSWVTKVCQ